MRSAILKIDMTPLFSAEGGPIWIKFHRLVQNDDCGDMVEIQTRYRIPIWRTFWRIQWRVIPEQLLHCRVLLAGKFNVMIPKATCNIAWAATWRIQWHVIPEPRITLQGAATCGIHCHIPRATCHIAGCSHVAKSMS